MQDFRYVKLASGEHIRFASKPTGLSGRRVATIGSLGGLTGGETEAIVFYQTDHLGTPVMLTDQTGQAVWKAEYLPFGEPVAINEDVDGDGVAVTNNLRFPGQYQDQETGLRYNWARYYDAKVGRFTTFDPLVHSGNGPDRVKSCSANVSSASFDEFKENPLKFNPYLYAEGNPVNLIDPQGLSVCGSTWRQRLAIPDSWFGWFSFAGPCAAHDSCYGCEGAKAGKTKADCDTAFLFDMRKICSGVQPKFLYQGQCYKTAYAYYYEVVVHGQSAFDAARKDCCKN